MIKKSYIISIVVIVSFLGISATWVISKANESINELPAVIKKVPDFSMTSHIGENFNLHIHRDNNRHRNTGWFGYEQKGESLN